MKLTFGKIAGSFFWVLAVFGVVVDAVLGTMYINWYTLIVFVLIGLFCAYFMQSLLFIMITGLIFVVVVGVGMGILLWRGLTNPLVFIVIMSVGAGISVLGGAYFTHRIWLTYYTYPPESVENSDSYFGNERSEKEAYERGKREGTEQGEGARKEAYEKGKREAQGNRKMTREEAYEYLGLKPNASKEQIKQAYRKLTKAIHPDATGQNTGTFMRELIEAYELLGGD